MSRALRLMRLSETLRASDTTTVEALADALKVSGRTVRRDLVTLRASDISPEAY